MIEGLTSKRSDQSPSDQQTWQIVASLEVLQHQIAWNVDANVSKVMGRRISKRLEHGGEKWKVSERHTVLDAVAENPLINRSDVRHIEDRQDDVELGASEFQVLCQAIDSCVANVRSINEREQP